MFQLYFQYISAAARFNYFNTDKLPDFKTRKWSKPRIFFYTKKTFTQFSPYTKNLKPRFGDSSFLPMSPLILSSLLLVRLVLFFKRIIRKRDKSLRKYWLTPRTLIRVTKQSKGARMGKGKGKHVSLLQRFPPLSPFAEFFRVREGRLRLFLKKLNSRMPVLFCLNTSRSFNHQASVRFIK